MLGFFKCFVFVSCVPRKMPRRIRISPRRTFHNFPHNFHEVSTKFPLRGNSENVDFIGFNTVLTFHKVSTIQLSTKFPRSFRTPGFLARSQQMGSRRDPTGPSVILFGKKVSVLVLFRKPAPKLLSIRFFIFLTPRHLFSELCRRKTVLM